MKTNKIAALLVSQLFDRKIIDDSAETCEEIALSKNIGINAVQRRMRMLLAHGKVDRVWKRVGERLVPAYIEKPK